MIPYTLGAFSSISLSWSSSVYSTAIRCPCLFWAQSEVAGKSSWKKSVRVMGKGQTPLQGLRAVNAVGHRNRNPTGPVGGYQGGFQEEEEELAGPSFLLRPPLGFILVPAAQAQLCPQPNPLPQGTEEWGQSEPQGDGWYLVDREGQSGSPQKGKDREEEQEESQLGGAESW